MTPKESEIRLLRLLLREIDRLSGELKQKDKDYMTQMELKQKDTEMMSKEVDRLNNERSRLKDQLRHKLKLLEETKDELKKEA